MQSTALPTPDSVDTKDVAAGVGSIPKPPKRPKTFDCQVECYGQGKVHTNIMKLLKISHCENPGIPIVLFIYKVSRETVDLRNALQWIEDIQGRKKEDICAVILLEKSSDTDKKLVEVAHLGMFDEKTAVVRILWKHRRFPLSRSHEKIQKGSSRAMDRIKQSIQEWQNSTEPDVLYQEPSQREERPACGSSAAGVD